MKFLLSSAKSSKDPYLVIIQLAAARLRAPYIWPFIFFQGCLRGQPAAVAQWFRPNQKGADRSKGKPISQSFQSATPPSPSVINADANVFFGALSRGRTGPDHTANCQRQLPQRIERGKIRTICQIVTDPQFWAICSTCATSSSVSLKTDRLCVSTTSGVIPQVS